MDTIQRPHKTYVRRWINGFWSSGNDHRLSSFSCISFKRTRTTPFLKPMITHIIALLIGFIAGALVFRNNAKKAERIVQDGKAVADQAKQVADKFRK